MKKNNDSDEIPFLIIGVIAGLALFWLFISPFAYESNIRELGQAICEEEYDMDFQSYGTKEGLTCKDKVKEIAKSYDGIKIIKLK